MSFFQGEINNLLEKIDEQLKEVSEFATHTQEVLVNSASSVDEKIAALQGQIDGMEELMGQYERRLDQVVQLSSSETHRQHSLTSLGICFGVAVVLGVGMALIPYPIPSGI